MTNPTLRLILAGLSAICGVLLASVADNAGWRVLGVLLAIAVPTALVASLRRNHSVAAMIGMITISTLVFAVGIPFAGIFHYQPTTAASGPAGSHSHSGGFEAGLPSDPQQLFEIALEHADTLVPGGSSSVLQVSLRDDTVQLRVYDPSNGNAVYSHYSSGKWWPPSVSRSSDRATFSRNDVSGLDLGEVTPDVIEVAKRLQIEPSKFGSTNDITVERRRGDELLVAEYSIDNNPIQVNAEGEVADTAGAGFLDEMLPTLNQALTGLRVDPRSVQINRLDFRTIADGSSPIAASSIQNSGGVLIDLSAGQYDSVIIVPGSFPLARPRNSREGPGFPLSAVTTAALVKARDDLLSRTGRPKFDGDLVGLQVGAAPGGRDEGPVIRIQVGPPGGNRAVAVYTLDGMFLREGTW